LPGGKRGQLRAGAPRAKMIIIKSDADLEGMRASAALVARVLRAVMARVSPGVTTGELADFADEQIRAAGAENAFLGYRGFPGKICASVNDEVVHGVPGERRVELGDIVSLDIGLKLRGFVGDTAGTVMVGVTDPRQILLVKTAERSLAAGIAAARAGNRLSDISHAVQSVCEGAGFSVVRDFVGHGIGRQMHEDPQVPNYGTPGKGPKLRPGMTLAIEPMVNMGGYKVRVDDDGWTVRTQDGMPSAHFEHMVAIREGEAEVLTRGS
jgi:methionyl aminopeptidase